MIGAFTAIAPAGRAAPLSRRPKPRATGTTTTTAAPVTSTTAAPTSTTAAPTSTTAAPTTTSTTAKPTTTTAPSTTTTTAAPGPAIVPGALSWAPPALTSPTTFVVTDATPFWLPTMDPSRDYRIVLPGMPGNSQTTPLNHGIGVNGGRNVVIIGGHISIPDSITDPEYRVGIKLRNQHGTVHVEGVELLNTSDAINMEQKYGAIVQLENIWARCPTPYETTFHSDIVQTWAGPAELRIDHLTGYSSFQGLMLDPNDPNFQTPAHPVPRLFDFRNINIVRVGTAGGYDYEHVSRGLNDPILGTALFGTSPTGKIVYTGYGPFPAVAPTLPPGGDFVTTGEVGLGYVSPGYLP